MLINGPAARICKECVQYSQAALAETHAYIAREAEAEALASQVGALPDRSILSIALGVQAARRGHRVAFASAQDWVGRLGLARRQGRLEEELRTFADQSRVPVGLRSAYARFAMRTVVGVAPTLDELRQAFDGLDVVAVEVDHTPGMPFLVAVVQRRG